MMQHLSAALKLSLVVLAFLFTSCKEENITNNYTAEGETPDVNIVYSEYALGTINSFHVDTSTSSYYNYTLDLKLILDKPENRSKVNKMIIKMQTGSGWEYFKDDLEDFYVDSIKGYLIKNMVIGMGSYQQSTPVVPPLSITLYSASNGHSNPYEIMINSRFALLYEIQSQWLSHDNYFLQPYFYYSIGNNWNSEVVWLNSQKQEVGRSQATNTTTGITVNDVPENAVYYYLVMEAMNGNIKSILKSSLMTIAERIPENVEVLEGSNFSLNEAILIDNSSKIMFVDLNNYKYYIYDSGTNELLNTIQLSTRMYNSVFSEQEKRIYYTSDNRKLYSIGLNETTPKYERSFSNSIYDLLILNEFLITSQDYDIKIINLTNDSVYTFSSNSYNDFRYLTFNSKNNVLYAFDDGYILRMNFDPSTGKIGGAKTEYFSSSSYPVTFSPDGSKLYCSNGYVYSSSATQNLDLKYLTDLGSSFTSGAFLSNSALVTLYYDSWNYTSDIYVYSPDYKLVSYFSNLYGRPQFLYAKDNTVKVISQSNGYSYKFVETFTYEDLIPGKKVKNGVKSEKFYLSKKL